MLTLGIFDLIITLLDLLTYWFVVIYDKPHIANYIPYLYIRCSISVHHALFTLIVQPLVPYCPRQVPMGARSSSTNNRPYSGGVASRLATAIYVSMVTPILYDNSYSPNDSY